MMCFPRSRRAARSFLRLAIGLMVGSWLALVQPGMSFYWLIDQDLHAQIDEELYGQRPHGETLPGHEHHPPHEHPITPGLSIPGLTLAHPFDADFYGALLSPAQRPALRGQRIELAVIAQSIAIAPPDQPPRPVT